MCHHLRMPFILAVVVCLLTLPLITAFSIAGFTATVGDGNPLPTVDLYLKSSS